MLNMCNMNEIVMLTRSKLVLSALHICFCCCNRSLLTISDLPRSFLLLATPLSTQIVKTLVCVLSI